MYLSYVISSSREKLIREVLLKVKRQLVLVLVNTIATSKKSVNSLKKFFNGTKLMQDSQSIYGGDFNFDYSAYCCGIYSYV